MMNKMSIIVTSRESDAHRSNKLSWLAPSCKAGNKATMSLEEIKRDLELYVFSVSIPPLWDILLGFNFRYSSNRPGDIFHPIGD